MKKYEILKKLLKNFTVTPTISTIMSAMDENSWSESMIFLDWVAANYKPVLQNKKLLYWVQSHHTKLTTEEVLNAFYFEQAQIANSAPKETDPYA